jgi:hypothetical protein
MGFSIFHILESLVLLANAIAILSDNFLKRCKYLIIKGHFIQKTQQVIH